METMKTYWDNDFGFGEIIEETETEITVLFYSDPWVYHYLPKKGKEIKEKYVVSTD